MSVITVTNSGVTCCCCSKNLTGTNSGVTQILYFQITDTVNLTPDFLTFDSNHFVILDRFYLLIYYNGSCYNYD